MNGSVSVGRVAAVKAQMTLATWPFSTSIPMSGMRGCCAPPVVLPTRVRRLAPCSSSALIRLNGVPGMAKPPKRDGAAVGNVGHRLPEAGDHFGFRGHRLLALYFAGDQWAGRGASQAAGYLQDASRIGIRCDRNSSAQARQEYRSAWARQAARSAVQRVQRGLAQIGVDRTDTA